MRIMPRLLIGTFLLLDIALASPEEVTMRLTENDPLVKQVSEIAPYFKYKVDIYLRRLEAEDYPAPLIRDLGTQLRHFSPGADPLLSAPVPPASSLLKNNARSQVQSTPFKVNDADSACWNASAAFSNVSNLFLYVWQDERKGTNNPDIYGQYFSQSLEPIGSNFRIHSENSGAAQSTPAVAPTSDGGFVVVWEDYREGDPILFYRCFNSSRTAKGQDAKVDETQNKDQYFPAVAADNLGFFTIVWLQDDAGDFNIYCRKFDNAGMAQRVSFEVNIDYQNLQWSPSVASSATGKTLIVWEDKRNGNSDIYGQRIRADGTRQASNFKINDDEGGSIQWRPFVASQSGQFIACWEDYQQAPNTIYAQWFDTSMLVVGSNVRVDGGSDAGLKEFPTVAINSNNQSLFAWQDGRNGNWDIYVGLCSADRVPLTVFSLNTDPLNGDQNRPNVFFGNSFSTFVWLNDFGEEEKQKVFTAQYDWTVVSVEFSFFKATANANDVHLEWATLTESNNLGFEIQRKTKDRDFEKICFIGGKGTTASENSYSYVDKGLFPGTYTYRLKQIDYDGECSYSSLTELTVFGPSQFSLSQNYPNPFNPSTCIDVVVPERKFVALTIFNGNGQLVRRLHSGYIDAGSHPIVWDARDETGKPVTAGVYYCCLETEDKFITRAMILLR
jgi:hypothetical protein